MVGDKELLVSLVQTKMPFGKYKGFLLCDLSEAYLLWFQQRELPKCSLDIQLQTVLAVKVNGVGQILADLKRVPDQNT